ncbi:hypothetical protein Leryth_018980 [Lithospermum erythrorhizon]|nr:hypothetical protein Leryth_018980 [Lithospermum erythrorhizon]
MWVKESQVVSYKQTSVSAGSGVGVVNGFRPDEMITKVPLTSKAPKLQEIYQLNTHTRLDKQYFILLIQALLSSYLA